MKRLHVNVLIFLTLISPSVVKSVTCRWADAILSEGRCLLYDSTRLTYSNAKGSCQSKGGVLAKVTSMTQAYEFTKQVAEGDGVWIGANDIDVEGTWVWEDGSTFDTDFWANNTLVNSEDESDCAFISSLNSNDRTITDYLCSINFPFICMEKDLITTPDLTTTASTTNDLVTTKPSDITILTSTSTEKTPFPNLMKCGAHFVSFNILLLLELLAFLHLAI